MECKKTANLEICNCSSDPCSRKGICCECISYHLKSRQLPGCCFNAEGERKYDRSFEHFAILLIESIKAGPLITPDKTDCVGARDCAKRPGAAAAVDNTSSAVGRQACVPRAKSRA